MSAEIPGQAKRDKARDGGWPAARAGDLIARMNEIHGGITHGQMRA